MESTTNHNFKMRSLEDLSSSSRCHIEQLLKSSDCGETSDPAVTNVDGYRETKAITESELSSLNNDIGRLGIGGNYSKEQTFIFFSKLPQELKDRIWKLFVSEDVRKINLRDKVGRYASGCRLPTIFRINRQLRIDALALYGYVELRRDMRDSYPVIFNPEVDMLYINSCVDWLDLEKAFICCGVTDRLRSIAVKVERGFSRLRRPWYSPWQPSVMNHLKKFKNLELLLVVRKEEKEQQSRNCENQWDLKFVNMDPIGDQVATHLVMALFGEERFDIRSVNVRLIKYHNVDGYGWDM